MKTNSVPPDAPAIVHDPNLAWQTVNMPGGIAQPVSDIAGFVLSLLAQSIDSQRATGMCEIVPESMPQAENIS